MSAIDSPPAPWMYVRLTRPGEHEHMLSLDAQIQQALSACDRCTQIYQQTGLVPVACHQCGAQRDELWLACIESAARRHPVQDAHPVMATRSALLGRLESRR